MNEEYKKIIKKYYKEKFLKYGTTSNGVDWNDDESHTFRILNLISHISRDSNDSILDFGCGYGKMNQLLQNMKSEIKYFGYDINDAIIQEAIKNNTQGYFFSEIEKNKKFDHVVANGIFNVSLDISKNGWKEHCYNTIDEMVLLSNKSVCFNMLTSYVDYEREHLCYFDPKEIFDRYINRNDTCITIRHFNKMYEFIVLIEKQ